MATRQKPALSSGLDADSAVQVSPRTAAEAAFHAPAVLTDEFADEQTPSDRISAMLSDFAESERASVKLYRVTGPQKYAWLNDYSPEEFEAGGLAQIRREWGAGEYQVRLYATLAGESHYGIRGKQNIVIEAMRESETPTRAVAQQSGELTQVLAMLADGQQRMLQALTERPAPVDPMAQMTTMLGTMKLMREAMGLDTQASQAPRSSITEILAAVRELRDVSDELNPKPAPAEDSLTALLGPVLETVKSFAPSRPADPGVMIAEEMPAVSLPASIAAAQAAPATATQGTQDVKLLDRAKKLAQEKAAQISTLAKMKGKIAEAIEAQAQGVDAPTLANALYEDEELPDDFFAVIQQPEWFAMLSAFAPEVVPHREFFTAVRDEVMKLLAAETDDDETPAGNV